MTDVTKYMHVVVLYVMLFCIFQVSYKCVTTPFKKQKRKKKIFMEKSYVKNNKIYKSFLKIWEVSAFEMWIVYRIDIQWGTNEPITWISWVKEQQLIISLN